MCEPITIFTALAVAQVALGEVERKQQNKIIDQNAAQQRKVFQQKAEQAANKFAGDQIASSEQLFQLGVETQQKEATAKTAASAAGVSGLSVDAVLADFTRQGGTGSSTIKQQLEHQRLSTDLSIEGARLGTESALMNLRKTKFNPVAAALQIGQGAATGFALSGAGGAKGPAKGGGGNPYTKIWNNVGK